jgi:three-Cys-motif partner protein
MRERTRLAADGLRARLGGPWTADKLYYLKRYAAGFMKAMTPHRDAGTWDSLVYIDLLAGPGIDMERRSGKEFPGSPLIALQTAPAFNRIFLGDLNRENVSALRQRIPPDEATRVDIDRADCHARATVVVSSLSSRTLGLAFVDPEGFEVRFELFETLASRAIDIVFLFPSGIGITRNERLFAQNSATPAIERLWGNSEWRELPAMKAFAGKRLTDSDVERLTESYAHAFSKRIATLGYTCYDCVGPLRNDQGAPMYHLLFFSKSPAGLSIWKGIGEIEPGGQRRLKGFE